MCGSCRNPYFRRGSGCNGTDTNRAIVAQAETEAQESNDFVTLADEGEKDDDIRDNQTFQEALVEIVKSFVKAFAETIVRYVKFIIDFINSQIGQQ